VGRLTPAKDPLTVLAAHSILVHRGHDVHLDLVGGGLVDSDEGYRRTVEDQIRSGGLEERVVLHGPVPYRDVPRLYRAATLVVNASHTGSLDKVALEAMACGRPLVSCNDSAPGLFAPLGPRAAELVFRQGNASELADRVEALLLLPAPERAELGRDLRSIVAGAHEVEHLMERLVREMAGAERVA
jgi:glycosyltransferase involved in cell wall biosynthesis